MPTTSSAVRLEIRGLIPAFKNAKRISGKRLITDRDTKARMEAIISSIVSQLLLGIQTAGDGTLTAQQVRSLTQSLPHDDCWTVIPELHVTAKLSSQDDVGATVVIEQI